VLSPEVRHGSSTVVVCAITLSPDNLTRIKISEPKIQHHENVHCTTIVAIGVMVLGALIWNWLPEQQETVMGVCDAAQKFM
jgi:hypothetical protein